MGNVKMSVTGAVSEGVSQWGPLDGFFEQRHELSVLQKMEDVFTIGCPMYLVPEHGSCHGMFGRCRQSVR